MKIAILCVLLLIACDGVSAQTVAASESDVRQTRISLSLKRAKLCEVFGHLLQFHGIRIGLEGSTLDNDHVDWTFNTLLHPERVWKPGIRFPCFVVKNEDRLFTIDVRDEPLEDLMDTIVSRMENYAWEVNEGVVNIYPIKGRDERFRRLLETRISKFSIAADARMHEIRKAIFELPEVKAFVKANALKAYAPSASTERGGWQKIGEPLEFADLTLKQLLNRITVKKGGGWIVRNSWSFVLGDDSLGIEV